MKWALCQCDCGTKRLRPYRDLYAGRSQSCGCLAKEKTIQMNWEIRFDFAIFDEDNNLIKLVEFQGRQHYFGPDAKWKYSDSLETIQERDKQKVDYCQQHNIPLLVIPYTDIDKINLKYLMKEIEI